jgi:hypothetical protein
LVLGRHILVSVPTQGADPEPIQHISDGMVNIGGVMQQPWRSGPGL